MDSSRTTAGHSRHWDWARRLTPLSSDRYALWRSLSTVALGRLLVAVFLIFSSLGLVVDIVDPRSSSFGWVLIYCAFSGLLAVGYVFCITRGLKLLVLLVPGQFVASFILNRLVPQGVPLVTVSDPALHHRLYLDGVGIALLVGAAWASVAATISRQLLEVMRTTVELRVAQRLQADLVPRVTLRARHVECDGRSVPSSQMGGDVVDAVALSDPVVGYVADVAGHGIAAGVLMAVTKSALRTHLLTPRPLSALLRDLNAVLPAMKDPARYVTLAVVRIWPNMTLEYALAGHLPILHFRRRTRSIVQLGSPQLAIGMFPEVAYESATTTVEAGDLVVLLTDGLTEVTNGRDEEFGLENVGACVVANADRRPHEVVDAILAVAAQYGRQQDDQSVLVLRVLESETR